MASACDACASGKWGLYRDGCLRCAVRKCWRVYNERERDEQAARWRDELTPEQARQARRWWAEYRAEHRALREWKREYEECLTD